MIGTVNKLADAIKSIATGLGITGRTFPKPAVTVQYPEVRSRLAERFRGGLKVKGMMGEDPMVFYAAEPRDYDAGIAEAKESLQLPPCVGSCPSNVDARGQNALVAEGKYEEALALVRDRNIMPGVLGRICHHPCEVACKSSYYDQALAIRPLHRFISAECHTRGTGVPERVEPTRAQRIAVIGAGPAGLAAAWDLTRLGYAVTVYDKNYTGGGALLTGVPTYRLPKEILQQESDNVFAAGIEFKGNVEIGKDVSFQDIRDEGYDVVIIAAGLQASRGLPIPGADLPGVLLALPFLADINQGKKVELGKRVIVIGGGNVAVDVARCALRAGAQEVHMSMLEAPHEVPAFPWEIEEAKEEGIIIHCSRGPVEVTGKRKVTGLVVNECTAVFDAQGRFAPCFNPENTWTIKGDNVIFSIGQGSELGWLADSGLEIDQRGNLVADRATGSTSTAGVFACGEVITGPGSAIASIASGHQCAITVDRFLKGEDIQEGRTFPPPAGGYPSYAPWPDEVVEEDRRRREKPLMPAEKRKDTFDQIEFTLEEDEALAEAGRCLRCLSEICVGCRMCMRACPDYCIDVVRTEAGTDRRIRGWELEIGLCAFCGLCTEACPTKTLTMSREFELASADKDDMTWDKYRMLRRDEAGAKDG